MERWQSREVDIAVSVYVNSGLAKIEKVGVLA